MRAELIMTIQIPYDSDGAPTVEYIDIVHALNRARKTGTKTIEIRRLNVIKKSELLVRIVNLKAKPVVINDDDDITVLEEGQ